VNTDPDVGFLMTKNVRKFSVAFLMPMKDFQATAIEREHPALQNMKFFFFF
jgi:hypothetical protein